MKDIKWILNDNWQNPEYADWLSEDGVDTKMRNGKLYRRIYNPDKYINFNDALDEFLTEMEEEEQNNGENNI